MARSPLSAWSDAELQAAVTAADEVLLKAVAADAFTQLAAKELRLREQLARSHAKTAKPADKAFVKRVAAVESLTEARINREVARYVKAWRGFVSANSATLDDTIAFGNYAGKRVIYQRMFGRKQPAVYEGPPYSDRSPKETYPVPVEKASLDIRPSTTLADERAIAQISKGQKFWIGKYHDDAFSNQIQQITREVMLERGLGRQEAGRVLGESLGYVNGYIPVKPAVEIPEGWTGGIKQYFDGVAANAATLSRIHGSFEAMMEMGIDVYEILNPLDERTCARCDLMNGAILDVRTSYQHMVDLIGAPPGTIPDRMPWLSESEFISRHAAGGAARLQKEGVGYPPFHFKCRCSVDVRPDQITSTVRVPATVAVPSGAKLVVPGTIEG